MEPVRLRVDVDGALITSHGLLRHPCRFEGGPRRSMARRYFRCSASRRTAAPGSWLSSRNRPRSRVHKRSAFLSRVAKAWASARSRRTQPPGSRRARGGTAPAGAKRPA
jgi:hypothetical protein